MPISTGFNYFLNKQLAKAKPTTLVGIDSTTSVGALNTTVIRFEDQVVPVIDAAANGGHGSLEIVEFPEGLVIVSGSTSDLTIAAVGVEIEQDAAVVTSVGTAAVSTSDATLTSTEADIIPSTAATLTGGEGAAKGKSSSIAVFDGTSATKSAYLNFAIPAADIADDDALTISGTITIVWTWAGDN